MKRSFVLLALVALTAAPALAAMSIPPNVMTALSNFNKVTSFHAVAVDHGHTVQMDTMWPPSKMHVTAGGMEAIKIDSDTYVKMGDSWHKFTIPGADYMIRMVTDRIQKMSHPDSDVTIVDAGMKTIDGVPLHEYDVQHRGTVESSLYLDNEPMVVRIESRDGGVITLSKFSAPLDIVAPL